MKLQPVQNRAVRIIQKINAYVGTEEMELQHKQLHLKFLSDRRKLFMLTYMYKMSLVEENVNDYRPEMLLRTGPNVNMKIDFTDRERV